MVKQFRKKPVVIEAIQYTGYNGDEIEKWSNEKVRVNLFFQNQLDVETLEGKMICTKHDWIIKGVKGEFYPCKPDIFEQTYEEVNISDNEM